MKKYTLEEHITMMNIFDFVQSLTGGKCGLNRIKMEAGEILNKSLYRDYCKYGMKRDYCNRDAGEIQYSKCGVLTKWYISAEEKAEIIRVCNIFLDIVEGDSKLFKIMTRYYKKAILYNSALRHVRAIAISFEGGIENDE